MKPENFIPETEHYSSIILVIYFIKLSPSVIGLLHVNLL